MLSELQTKKLTRYFEVYDIDDDGRIAAADFDRIVENVQLLHGVGGRSSAAESLRAAYATLWDRIRSSADVDGSQSVDLDEWLAFWQTALEDDGRYHEEVQAITDRLFTVFDVDEDDSIGPSEFADFYGVFGLAVHLAETVFATLDVNGDGVITRDELLSLSGDFFRSTDPESSGNFLFGPYGA